MASSKELLSQMQQYNMGGAPVAIESAIKDAYAPAVKSLINEGNQLRETAYPSFFNAFDSMGTGAADMSPAAALGAAIGQGERDMSAYRTNLGLRDYYGTIINDLSGKAMQGYQLGYNQLKDLYGIQNSREQATRAMAAARARSLFNANLQNTTGNLTSTGEPDVPRSLGGAIHPRLSRTRGAVTRPTSGIRWGSGRSISGNVDTSKYKF